MSKRNTLHFLFFLTIKTQCFISHLNNNTLHRVFVTLCLNLLPLKKFKPLMKSRQTYGIMAAHNDRDGFNVSPIETSARFISNVQCEKLYEREEGNSFQERTNGTRIPTLGVTLGFRNLRRVGAVSARHTHTSARHFHGFFSRRVVPGMQDARAPLGSLFVYLTAGRLQRGTRSHALSVF